MIYLLIAGIAFIAVAALNWKHGNRRACRWRADQTRNRGALRFYRCAACGAEAYTARKDAPQGCKRGLDTSAL
ncbi:MAG: hypothetical protein ACSHWZ_03245 [Sulfitobacter sp.]